MMLLSNTIVDFHLFYDGAVDMQICAFLKRHQCKVSDTQVTAKACRPLAMLCDSRFKVIDIRSKIAIKFKMTAISRKMHMDTKYNSLGHN